MMQRTLHRRPSKTRRHVSASDSLRRIALTGALLLLPIGTAAWAGSGLLGLDHVVALDDKGIWARNNQLWLLDSMLAAEVGAGLWEGGNTRFGHTIWQSIDATVVGGVVSEVSKYAFSRERPSQTSDPNEWFKGHRAQSFPSGEVTVVSAIVTPLVLEYRSDNPVIYALEILPLYDAIARVKVHGHWQSDVIAGYAIGSAAGYFMHERRQIPLVLSIMPHGVFIGLKKSL
jgi:membrane-associated phospholipid phosphatase